MSLTMRHSEAPAASTASASLEPPHVAARVDVVALHLTTLSATMRDVLQLDRKSRTMTLSSSSCMWRRSGCLRSAPVSFRNIGPG